MIHLKICLLITFPQTISYLNEFCWNDIFYLGAPTFVVTPAVLDKEREFVKGIEIRRVYLKGKQMIVKLGWSKIPKIGEISSVFGL